MSRRSAPLAPAHLRRVAEPRTWDLLACWVAEAGTGSWEELSQMARSLGIRPGAAMRALVRLAQLEIDWRARRFSACPPVLCRLPGHPQLMLWAGARVADQDQVVDRVADELDLEIDVLRLDQQRRGPESLLIEGHPAELDRLATGLGLPARQDLAEALAGWLGEIDTTALAMPGLPDEDQVMAPTWPGTGIERRELSQTGLPRSPGAGVWVVREFTHLSVSWICAGGDWWRVAEREWAPYLVWREGQPPLAEYDPLERVLCAHAGAPLPGLAARTLVLCSGQLPGLAFDRERLDPPPQIVGPAELYVNVPPAVARAVLAHLGQPRGEWVHRAE